MQTTLPPYASSLREGWSKVVAEEGYAGLYKGIYPLWARQIPYTMVKFATFESAVEMIYKSLNKPKESYTTLQQTGVSFLGGYIAGIGCAVVSHPADVMVSKLNADRKRGEAAMSAVGRIYKNIGFAGLWNGLPVRIAMIGTLTVCFCYFLPFLLLLLLLSLPFPSLSLQIVIAQIPQLTARCFRLSNG